VRGKIKNMFYRYYSGPLIIDTPIFCSGTYSETKFSYIIHFAVLFRALFLYASIKNVHSVPITH
jgi:hypothetical protein